MEEIKMEEIKAQIKKLEEKLQEYEKGTFKVEKEKIYGRDFIIITNPHAKTIRRIEMVTTHIKNDIVSKLISFINDDIPFSREYIYEINEFRGRDDDVSITKIKNTNDYCITYNFGTEGAGSTYHYTINKECLCNVLSLIKVG